MRPKSFHLIISCLILFLILASAGCNLRSGTATPGASLNPTQSYMTAVARVTAIFLETSAAGGSPTPTATPTAGTPGGTPGTGTATATATITPIPPTSNPSGTPNPCDRAAAGNPIDVTIPDNTVFGPETPFIKTWRLINAGTCTWTTQYAVVWVSGAQIGDNDVVSLSASVPPGGSVDISVPMTSPEDPGTYQSYWKLRNGSGVLFGIGNDYNSTFWALIQVAAATATPTITPTPTVPVATATATPVVFAGGSANLVPNDTLDLDSISVNPGGGVDLSYAIDAGSNHLLSPQGGAKVGVFGSSVPGLGNCQAASLGTAPLAVESLGVGTFLCYQTDSGRYGWLQISSFNSDDGALGLQVLTWAAP